LRFPAGILHAMPLYDDPADGLRMAPEALERWTAALVERVGTPPDIAADVAEILVASDLRGIASHGTARLPQYVALAEAGTMDPAARPVRERGRPALALFDARNGWGHHAGRVAMDDAIERALTLGTAMSVVRNSNHYGIAGWYAIRAAEGGLIGASMTNTSPLVAPTRARISMLGTNPIAVAAPAGSFGTMCLDMATSTITRGRIEVAARRDELLEPGWAIGPDGSPATTPDDALAGALQPLGGGEGTAGYKGYGLALVVELLTGVLAGAAFGPNIAGLFSTETKSDLGQWYIAIDPAAIGDPGAFEGRLERLLQQLTEAPLIPNAPGPVLYPGQPEAERAERSRRDGIVIDRAHHTSLLTLARRLRVPLPDPIPAPARTEADAAHGRPPERVGIGRQ
jgi:LDH2 family malate/lactate/ureidoglycolate dehydrogenase